MPVRSLNLKMILSRGEAGREIRQALWSTHSAVNRAVGELEAVLLLCRGRAYCTGDDELVPGDEGAKGSQREPKGTFYFSSDFLPPGDYRVAEK